MEEVSKGMHSIIKMISNRKNNKFPILRLPYLAIQEIFKAMHPIEIINFSMISKRTRTLAKFVSFYSKYSIRLSVENSMLKIRFFGTKNVVSCCFLMTRKILLNGKIEEGEWGNIRTVFKFSKNAVDEWKQFCKYALEIFKIQTIDDLTLYMDAFVDQNVSIIDFLITNVKSVEECYLYHLYKEKNVDWHTAYLLNNITVNAKLFSKVNIRNKNFNGKMSKNLKEIYIYNSRWIGYKMLLDIDCKNVILEKNRISDEQWNLFLKKWIAMETHLNLEYLELDYRDIEEFRALVLHDIPHEVVDRGVKRVLKTYCDEKRTISGGIDIRQIDGKTATFFSVYSFQTLKFAMSIH
ncbi:hypothetical protein CRE_11608 [Caenorhabditis remanei]|uniref:F-box domain-containing protein n=1 Tax=Caenorhabditis remanei TaxID=31234 RepID=E3NSK1_CAERE|nr:hypothetical protein CRE_11608 [Caenorhabditis remanei]